MYAGGIDLGLLRWLLLSIGVAFASSFDGFMVGLAYSIRGLRISSAHYWIMGTCTGTMIGVSMIFGKLLASVMPDNVETCIGAVILICIGIWQIRQQTRVSTGQHLQEADSRAAQVEQKPDTPGVNVSRKSTGPQRNCLIGMAETVVAILNEPLKADQDLSGTIDTKEAWLLSVALGLDAFAAGLGASVVGFSMLLIPLSALASPAFVFLGITVGKVTRADRHLGRNQILPGIVLIAIGLMKMFGCF